MKGWEKEKQAYDAIEIPPELRVMVKKTIQYDRAKKAKQAARKKKILVFRSITAVAAAAIVFLVVGVNTSYAFAKEVSRVPVAKTIAKTVRVRDYSEQVKNDPDYQSMISGESINENYAEFFAEVQEKNQIPTVDTEDVPVVPETEVAEETVETEALQETETVEETVEEPTEETVEDISGNDAKEDISGNDLTEKTIVEETLEEDTSESTKENATIEKTNSQETVETNEKTENSKSETTKKQTENH